MFQKVASILKKSITPRHAPIVHYIQALWPTMPVGTWQVVSGNFAIYRSGYVYLIHQILLAEALADLAVQGLGFTSVNPVSKSAAMRANEVIESNWPANWP
jgi:hypothetical protein